MVGFFHHRRLPIMPLSLSILFCFYLRVSTGASDCNRTCGANTVPYPFGFSPGCGILLDCGRESSSGVAQIQVGGFMLRNITQSHLLVDVPPACDRPIQNAQQLFAHNYAMTWQNGLLLRGCSSNVSGCVIPTHLVQRFNLSGCGADGDTISCYSSGNASSIPTAANLSATGCRFLFTTIAYNTDEAPFTSLNFRTAELSWWLEGACRCSLDANCKNLTSLVTGKPAFSCICKEGFEGDGFTDGSGCRRARPRCNASSKYTSGTCGGTTRVGVLVGGIIAGASIMAAVAFLCYLVWRQTISSRIRKTTERLLSQASCMVPIYTYKDMEKATNGFSDSQRLGTGAYGTVYAGKLNNDKLVAIKKIRHRDTEGIEQVMNEIRLLSSVSHPNLVRLLGCCIERGEQILIFEFMPNGTLLQHLQRERGNGLPWTVRLNIATETAEAIAHLHSTIHPPIYHRDIKSSNILLDYNFNSKVADFGLSRIGMTERSHISTAPQGTPGYLDPQYYQDLHLSDKSDVYSFGVVLLEIITALKVVDFNRVQSEVNLAALAVDKIGKGLVDEIIDPFLDLSRDAWTLSSIHKVAELAFRCLAFHRDMRPSMMEVADELEQIRRSGWAAGDDSVLLSSTSSLSNGTERSRGMCKSRQVVSANPVMEEFKLDSPMSVQDPWFGEQSSPSANSLLGSVIH